MNFKKLENFMDYLTSWRIPGCGCKVYKKGELVFEYTSGYADIENKIPLSCDDHRMFMYSISKIVTCVTALTLFEEGKYLLTDPVSMYMPEWADVKVREWSPDGNHKIHPVERPITIRDLFCMTSGLDYNCESEHLMAKRKETEPHCPTVEIIRALAKDPMNGQPGKIWGYGLSHDVIGALVEIWAGEPLGVVAKKRIFDPLGLKKTSYGLDPAYRGEMAVQYCFNDEKDCIEKNWTQDNWAIFGDEYHSGGAGVVSTISEMATFMKVLAAKGKVDDNTYIISPKTIDLMRAPHLTDEEEKGLDWPNLAGYSYGLGVRTMKYPAKGGSNSPVGEFGWTGAAGGYAAIDPDNEIAIFYAHHMLNNQESFVAPRIRNIVYSCIEE